MSARHLTTRLPGAATARCLLPLLPALLAGCATPTPGAKLTAVARPLPALQLSGEHAVVPIDASPCRGPADAPVTIVEFTDFECGHCAKGQELLRALELRHPGEVRVCFKHRTIPLHMFSRDAAEAAAAAGRQGRFWEMHDLLFAHQRALGPEDLHGYARRLGLDLERFQRDRLSEEVFAEVDRDEALAAELNVKSTPTFFFNGRQVLGAKPLDELEAIYQQALGDAALARAAGVADHDIYDALLRAARGEQVTTSVIGGVPILSEDPCRGPADAPVTVVEFTDFECPFCGMAKQTIDALEQHYRGRLRLCIKMSPMPYHAHGRSAALLALAAHRQGQFFALYDDLFAHQQALDDASVLQRAAALGLDAEQLRRDAADPALARQLERHRSEASQAQLRGTPGFVINDEVIFGAKPYAEFEDAVERQLGEQD